MHTSQPGEPLVFWDDWDFYTTAPYERVAKTDARAKYREASASEQGDNKRCYGCRFYQWGTCNLVEGTVEANGYCNLFTAMPVLYPQEMTSLVGKGKGGALFIETRAFAEQTAPEWIQYFPAPGRFNHPTYGEIVITEDRNRRMVDNFASGVYQTSIPVDCEHDLVTSGAVGWIEEMRLAADGSIEARVNWNERGTRLLSEDRFRYFSPAVLPQWSHTETGELIPDVAVGGAICTQPYFKESYLRPLVATEDGGLSLVERPRVPVASDGEGKAVRPVRTMTLAPVVAVKGETAVKDGEGTNPGITPAATPMQLSDAEVTAFREFQAKGGLAKFAELEERATQHANDLAALRREQRDARFREYIAGYETFADGTKRRARAWAGDVNDHLAILHEIADQHGETSEQFTRHLRVMRAQAAAGGATFSEVGTGEAPEDIGDGAAEFLAKVDEIQKGKDGMSYAEASAEAVRKYPQLYAEYRKANTVKV